MSIRRVKLPDGETKWEVRIREEGRGSRRVRRRFDRKTDAEEFMIEFNQRRREKRLSPFKTSSFEDRTFEEEAAYWESDGKLRFSPGHLVRIQAILAEILPRFGKHTIDRFTPEFLAKYQQEEKAKGLADSTVNRKTEVFTTILNFSAKHRRIPFNPTKGFQKLREKSHEMLFWDRSEAESFLHCMSDRYPPGSEHRWRYVAYLLALNTAMRAGEIWGLRPTDLAEDGRSIVVKRQFNRVSLEFGPTKSKKHRFVPCNSELLKELKALIDQRSIRADETIFMNKERNPICHDNFSDRVFGQDQKHWEGRRIRFHDLRHTATTLMIANGVDIKTVKEICGHADIATTMNYVHMVAGAVERVAEIFRVAPARDQSIERKEENGPALKLVTKF